MLIAQYAPEGAAAAVLLLAPPVLGVVSFWPSARGHWAGAVLAAPSLLFGFVFTAAVSAMARDWADGRRSSTVRCC